MARKITVEIIAALLILLFIYAALSKLLDYQRFSVQLSKSPLLSSFASAAAIGVPLMEIVISFLLLNKRSRSLGLYASLFLLSLFTFYLIAIINFSYYIPCSCGGILQGLSWNAHIIFNTAFILITIIGIILERRIQNASPQNSMTLTKA